MKTQIIVDGKTYEVEYDDPQESAASTSPVDPIQSLVLPTAPDPRTSALSSIDEAKLCRSPVDGIVTRIDVGAGKDVADRDVLLVVEAMKMENNIIAPATAKIRAIKVRVGDPVKVGQILVDFE